MRTLVEIVIGSLCGSLVATYWNRYRCRQGACLRRARFYVVYYWPRVMGKVYTENGADVLIGEPSAPPGHRGPFCFRHANAECSHWTAEFSKHDFPLEPPRVAVEPL